MLSKICKKKGYTWVRIRRSSKNGNKSGYLVNVGSQDIFMKDSEITDFYNSEINEK